MKKLVIIPGGFHPFHAGHLALYDAAKQTFPSADVFVAATADTSNRPFPFAVKKFLAQQAGVPGNRFIQVKSPFRAEEITQMYDPEETQLIFVRSEKDRDEQPQPGSVKKDGTPGYLQPYKRNGLQPFSKHGYMAYLPTVQFGAGMTSATEIRAKWPKMSSRQKIKLIKILYPGTAANDAAAAKIVAMFDETIGKPVEEAVLINDPDAGHQIVPDGGMGTWDEASLVSNLSRKFADMVGMVKNKNYSGLQYALYQGGVVKSMVDALAQYSKFMAKQGRRPIARGREIDLSQVAESPDYIDEADVLQFPADRQAPANLEKATDIAHRILDIAKDTSVSDPTIQARELRNELQMMGYRLRFDQGGLRLIHTATNWNTIIDPLK
jgi:hypothetical protein